MIARALGGPSYSFTAHGPDEFDSARERAIGAKLAGAAFAIAISHYCKSRLMLYGGPEHARKIHIVHCGITPDDFEHTRPITADNRTLVCVGRLCTQKAQVLLPAVAAALRKDFPGLRIVMIGDGESRGDIERGIAEHGVGDVIELRGWRSNAEVREAIAGCRAVLLPSFAEGLPVIIMEAFASGRPVISTYIAGIPEILDQSTGWIVPAGDQEALAEALRAALAASPAELQRMGARGRAIVVREFDIDTEARRLLGHLRNAIAAERAGAGSAVARTGLAVRAGSNVRRT
jgi:glycosyltransferase involved in cell wall biosynthesis